MAKRRKGLFAALLSAVMLFVSLMTALLPALTTAFCRNRAVPLHFCEACSFPADRSSTRSESII